MTFTLQSLLASGMLNTPPADLDLTGVTRLVTLGDSIADGSNASPTSNAFREKLKDYMLWGDSNLAVGGRGYYVAISSFNQFSFSRTSTIVIDETGLNDVRRSWSSKTRNKIRASVDSVLARMAGKASYASGSSSVTRSGGTFSSFDAQSVGGVYPSGTLPGNFGSSSSSNGAKWSWTFNTSAFFIAFSGSDGSAARGPCEVWVDGVLIDTITDLDQSWDGVSDGANANTVGPDTRVYWDFGTGPHTCEVIVTGSTTVAIDRFVEMDDPENVGVYLLIEAPKVTDYNKVGLDQADDAVMTATNKIRIRRLNRFNARGYRFYYVPIMKTSGGFYELPADIDADGVHPVNSGHQHIFDSIARFITPLIKVRDTFTGTSVSIASHSPEIGGAWTIGAGTITINGSGKLVASSSGECTQDTGSSDADIAIIARVTTTNNNINIVFRYTDTNNYIMVVFLVNGGSSTYTLINRVGGSNSGVTTGSVGSLSSGTDYRIKATLKGNHIMAWLNDTLYLNYTDALNANIGINNPAGTEHGLRVTTISQFDSIVCL